MIWIQIELCLQWAIYCVFQFHQNIYEYTAHHTYRPFWIVINKNQSFSIFLKTFEAWLSIPIVWWKWVPVFNSLLIKRNHVKNQVRKDINQGRQGWWFFPNICIHFMNFLDILFYFVLRLIIVRATHIKWQNCWCNFCLLLWY